MPSCCELKPCCNKSDSSQQIARSVALAGNPNCGKTTLFNALTGARQRVGNWPGVTVEKKCGTFTADGKIIETVDLPGVYSLTLASTSAALDERIACDFIMAQCADTIVNIVDASNLERHLYLTTQLIEMGAPVIVALNMMDVARQKKIKIDTAALAQSLGCPVVAIEASKGEGIYELKRVIAGYKPTAAKARITYPGEVEHAIQSLNVENRWLAIRLLENDAVARSQVNAAILAAVQEQQAHIQQQLNEDADILLADARYQFVSQVVASCVTRGVNVRASWTSRMDKIVLNRMLGIPIFLAVMYGLFFFAINIGGAFQDFFDISSQTIFVDGLAALLTSVGSPTWLTVLLANGFGKGINTTITFIPVIGAMFLFLAFLEDSGYMARAAFVIDRFMRLLGLPGKAFVPMIVGFGCNVPAVMGARTLENKRD